MITNQEFHIEGMHCGACVRRVTSALTKLDGVEVQRVEIGGATLSLDLEKTAPAEVTRAIEQIGFRAIPGSAVPRT
jgi:copper chaperone/Cu+-exporting ATPase